MYLYLTTTGRVTGQTREIEIWFAEHGGRFYLVAERESANWVRNIQWQPRVKVRVGDATFDAIARSEARGRCASRAEPTNIGGRDGERFSSAHRADSHVRPPPGIPSGIQMLGSTH